MTEEYDVAIVGAGGAGLTSAIYAVRAGMKTALFEAQMAGGLATTAPEIENFPSHPKINGAELMALMREHALNYVNIKEGEMVTGASKLDNGMFEIRTSRGTYHTTAVIIATGAGHKKLGVKGEEEYSGKGVSYCATCDGFFFKGRKVIMVGGGSTAIMDAIYLKNVGCDVTVVHRRNELRAEKVLQDKLFSMGVDVIWNSRVVEIRGNGQSVTSVVLEDVTTGEQREMKVEGVFVDVGQEPNNALAKDLGAALDKGGYIVTDKGQRTNVEGLYAAGDVCGGVRQLIVACGEGAVAAMSAFDDVMHPYWSKKA